MDETMPIERDVVDLEASVAEVAIALFAPGTVDATLRQIVRLAEHAVEGCDGAGVMVVADGVVTTAAASNDFVVAIDDLQIAADEGPCVDACRTGDTFYAQDLLTESRWPSFAPAGAAAGVRSILTFALSTGSPSALNLYGGLPAAFGAMDRASGHLFATLARLALDSAAKRAAGEKRADDLMEALRTREVIGQAQGILMERERITGYQAFSVLRQASQRMNLKLRDIAEALVETGESPDTDAR